MNQEQIFSEMKSRLQREVDYFGGNIPERVALVWYGYIAALLEWDLISIDHHDELADLLPQIPDNPVIAVFLGRSK